MVKHGAALNRSRSGDQIQPNPLERYIIAVSCKYYRRARVADRTIRLAQFWKTQAANVENRDGFSEGLNPSYGWIAASAFPNRMARTGSQQEVREWPSTPTRSTR